MAAGSPRSVAPERKGTPSAAPSAIPITLVGGGLLPLGFFVAGLLGLTAAAGLLAWHPQWLRFPHFHPQVVAVVHLWLPGGLVAIAAGACYQLMPVILGTPLRARRGAAWWHLGLHVSGIAGLVIAFAAGRYDLAVLPGALVAVGTTLLHGSAARTFCRSTRRDAVAWSLPVSTGWLALTAFSGVLLAWNRYHPIIPLEALGLLRAHAHVGLVGFFGSLLQGATFQLLPMFVMGEVRRPRFVLGGFVMVQVGLVTLVIGLAGGIMVIGLVGTMVTALGFALSGVALIATWRSRRKRRADVGIANFLAGAGFAAGAALLATLLVVSPVSDAVLLRGAMVYGVLLIGGALPLMLLGMLGKILPFLVWMRAYGPFVGRRPVPLTTQLSIGRLEAGFGVVHAVAITLIVLAIALDHSFWLLRVGVGLLAVGLGAYAVNALVVLRHLLPRKSHDSSNLSKPDGPAFSSAQR